MANCWHKRHNFICSNEILLLIYKQKVYTMAILNSTQFDYNTWEWLPTGDLLFNNNWILADICYVYETLKLQTSALPKMTLKSNVTGNINFLLVNSHTNYTFYHMPFVYHWWNSAPQNVPHEGATIGILAWYVTSETRMTGLKDS